MEEENYGEAEKNRYEKTLYYHKIIKNSIVINNAFVKFQGIDSRIEDTVNRVSQLFVGGGRAVTRYRMRYELVNTAIKPCQDITDLLSNANKEIKYRKAENILSLLDTVITKYYINTEDDDTNTEDDDTNVWNGIQVFVSDNLTVDKIVDAYGKLYEYGLSNCENSNKFYEDIESLTHFTLMNETSINIMFYVTFITLLNTDLKISKLHKAMNCYLDCIKNKITMNNSVIKLFDDNVVKEIKMECANNISAYLLKQEKIKLDYRQIIYAFTKLCSYEGPTETEIEWLKIKNFKFNKETFIKEMIFHMFNILDGCRGCMNLNYFTAIILSLNYDNKVLETLVLNNSVDLLDLVPKCAKGYEGGINIFDIMCSTSVGHKCKIRKCRYKPYEYSCKLTYFFSLMHYKVFSVVYMYFYYENAKLIKRYAKIIEQGVEINPFMKSNEWPECVVDVVV